MGDLTREQEEEYREAFTLFDKDNSGFITSDELSTVMRSLGQNPTNAEIQRMIHDADKDDDGNISFQEFARMMETKRKSGGENDQGLEQAFQVFDKNGDGFISAKELREIMTNLGEPLTQQEVDEMISEADTDGNDMIDYKEFSALMNKKNF